MSEKEKSTIRMLTISRWLSLFCVLAIVFFVRDVRAFSLSQLRRETLHDWTVKIGDASYGVVEYRSILNDRTNRVTEVLYGRQATVLVDHRSGVRMYYLLDTNHTYTIPLPLFALLGGLFSVAMTGCFAVWWIRKRLKRIEEKQE